MITLRVRCQRQTGQKDTHDTSVPPPGPLPFPPPLLCFKVLGTLPCLHGTISPANLPLPDYSCRSCAEALCWPTADCLYVDPNHARIPCRAHRRYTRQASCCPGRPLSASTGTARSTPRSWSAWGSAGGHTASAPLGVCWVDGVRASREKPWLGAAAASAQGGKHQQGLLRAARRHPCWLGR